MMAAAQCLCCSITGEANVCELLPRHALIAAAPDSNADTTIACFTLQGHLTGMGPSCLQLSQLQATQAPDLQDLQGGQLLHQPL